ncbi:thiamine pyrophosphate-binding protein [Streptomyces rubiginosohelvolus]|uniref:thiamine pyrophosphate-binding protein n=1 Tax=Streptomyces rubiginosohelvolus TaxID=67362 RepID=UPI0013C08F9C|nr:sulfopyruvate decarboxylase subunit alpha [Streptomyces sp. SID6648]
MRAPVVCLADELAEGLADRGFGPYYGTPCGILAPLFAAVDRRAGLLPVVREDNAVGMAAGAALAGKAPVVLMQNSGLGQSVNALASLTVPYGLAMLLIVSLRGVAPDPTQENLVMGRVTEPLLAGLGIETATLNTVAGPAERAAWAHEVVVRQGRPAALLVPPTAFGWRP